MRMHSIRITAAVFLALLAVPGHLGAQEEESQVLATVQRFFDSMTARDTASARDVLVMDATYFSVRQGTDGTVMRGSTNRQYVEQLAAPGDVFLEQMFDPRVLIHKDIAVVWTRYDFHRNGAFSHCGVDAFSLVRTNGQWKIAGIVYTVERECGEE